MNKLFELVGSIRLDAKEATDGLKKFKEDAGKAGKDAKGLGEKVKDAGKKMKKAGGKMKSVGSSLTKGLTLPLVGIGTAGLAAANKMGDMADELLDLSAITGMSTDSLQEWRHVADVAGVSQDTVAESARRMTDRMDKLSESTDENAEMFDKLGVSQDEWLDMSQDERMSTTIAALADMDDEMERNMIAQEFFGRGWKDLAPILDSSSGEISDVKDEAHELNKVMGEDSLNDANDFRVEMQKLKDEFGAVGRDLVMNLLPILKDQLLPMIRDNVIPFIQDLAEWVADLAEWFNGLSDPMKMLVVGFGGLLALIGPALSLLGSLATILGAVAAAELAVLWPVLAIVAAIALVVAAIVIWMKYGDQIKEWLRGLGESIKEAWNNLTEWIGEKWESFKTWSSELWQSIIDGIVQAWTWYVEKTKENWNNLKIWISEKWTTFKETAKQLWQNIIDGIVGVFTRYVETTKNNWNALKEWLSARWTAFKETAANLWKNITDPIVNLWNNLKESVSNIWNNIETTASSVWNGIKNTIQNAIEGARDIVGNAIDTIKGFFNFEFKWPDLKMPKFGFDGGFSINPPSVPKFNVSWHAAGGIFDEPTLFPSDGGFNGVGEAGPEAIIPLNSSTLGGIGEGIAREMRGKENQNGRLESIVESGINRLEGRLEGVEKAVDVTVEMDRREVGKAVQDEVDTGLGQKQVNRRVSKGII